MKKPAVALVLTSLSALALAGCSSASAQTDGGQATGNGDVIQVVASTNVYGSLVEEIGGDRVSVTSIIDSVTQDPHSYEASARDRLAVQKADFIVHNGGGYDAFIDTLLDGLDDKTELTAVEYSDAFNLGNDNVGEQIDEHEGETTDDHAEHADDATDDHAGETAEEHAEHADDAADDHAGHDHIEGFNEHVWFDPHTMVHVVEGIVEDLSKLDPKGAEDFAAAGAKLTEELEGFEADLKKLGTDAAGTTVFIPEPLTGYIAAAAGFTDVTPEGFAEAVEEGTDVAPATLLAALKVIEDGSAKLVLANAQTGGPETDRVLAAAKTAGLPIVEFTEMLPEGSSYAKWMRDGIDNLANALQK